jgi:Calcineurin-like phosphoesterase
MDVKMFLCGLNIISFDRPQSRVQSEMAKNLLVTSCMVIRGALRVVIARKDENGRGRLWNIMTILRCLFTISAILGTRIHCASIAHDHKETFTSEINPFYPQLLMSCSPPFSYATGAAHIWDEWFGMISPFSTSIPLMVSIGNHEYDHSDGGIGKDLSGVTTADGYRPPWGDFMEDSGGECGTPMAKRFRMPTSKLSNGVFWYSHDFANVHTVVISSEHDLSRGSPQFDFLLHDLKNVDRSVTPWVVLETHRPLYEGESGEHWMSNTLVGEAMRGNVEDLLFDYDVDIVLGGHYHEYHRYAVNMIFDKYHNMYVCMQIGFFLVIHAHNW